MSLAPHLPLDGFLDAEATPVGPQGTKPGDTTGGFPTVSMGPLLVELASNPGDVRASQQLRYRVFAEEMGAHVQGAASGLDEDLFDRYCDHLLVRDAATRRVVASTRILTGGQAWMAGGFYSQSEFDLSGLRRLPERVMEVGRTCVDPAYRTGAAINGLWTGLARYMVRESFDAMIGCASVPLVAGDDARASELTALCRLHASPDDLRVMPLHGLDDHGFCCDRAPDEESGIGLPPLLKGYLRLGAHLCGPPAFDPAFSTADLFIFLDVRRIPSRYHRHFLKDTRVNTGARDDGISTGEF